MKEFDLSSKIKELEELMLKGYKEQAGMSITAIHQCSDLFKEFIRQLKETEIDLRDIGLTYEKGEEVWKIFNELINKLAGEYLNGI